MRVCRESIGEPGIRVMLYPWDSLRFSNYTRGYLNFP